MSMPLIATKLYRPARDQNWIARPPLAERLDESQTRRLTLLSAPAGSGKTTLLSQWCAGRGDVAWIALDGADNAPERFLSYLITALQQVAPGAGAGALAVLRAADPAGAAAVPALLVNDLAGLGGEMEITLVLDDYQEITADAVHQLIAFLLDRLPPHVHLIVAAHADPPLPLARLRARGQLLELRGPDLRFTPAETTRFLRHAMKLELTDQAVAQVAERTEGWVAGLHLAALTLQGKANPAEAITALSGSHRFIFDFLAEDVFGRCPDPVQAFLLDTAVLDRLCGGLCNAVTGGQDGQRQLEDLERAGLFLVPLDQERHWYRYHRLFGQFLSGLLERRDPARATERHRRAAAWLDQSGDLGAALPHYLAAGDAATAARRIEAAAREMLARGEVGTFLRWVAALPPSLVDAQPRLGLFQAWAYLLTGQVAAAGERIVTVERHIPPADPGEVAAIRSTLMLLKGDLPATLASCREALAQLPAENQLHRAQVTINLARTAWLGLDIEGAMHSYAEGAELARQAGRPLLSAGASFALGQLYAVRGELRRAVAVLREALQAGAAVAGPHLPAAALGHLWLAEMLLEQNDLPSARQHAETGLERCRPLGNLDGLTHGHLTLAQVWLAQGDAQGALALLDGAANLAREGAPRLLGRIAVGRAQFMLAQGDLEALGRWVTETDPTAALNAHNEAERITLGRALVALKRTAEAVRLLERVVSSADRLGWHGTALKARVPLTLALQAQGDTKRAADQMQKACTLAEAEGYLRVFLDQGAAVLPLLPPNFADRLRGLLGVSDVGAGPLSGRELEVLRLMSLGCGTREIAARLVVTEGTAKWHIHNLLSKLEAGSRTQALARARELKLL